MSILGVAISTLSVFTVSASNGELTIGAGQSVSQIIESQKGQRVTLVLSSGKEMTGTVKTVIEQAVQLHAISGKEFFDAVVAIDRIEAVLIRTRDE